MIIRARLHAGLRVQSRDFDGRWLEGALEIAAFGELSQLLEVYTVAARRVGPTPFSRDARAIAALDSAAADFRFDRWTLQDAARAIFLLARAEVSPNPEVFVSAALACYEQGDTQEQLSWLRAVGLLPHAERFLFTVIDACRTNILPLFEAVACENPYPARYFPDANFNQLVLKALFNGIALARIVGLSARANVDLSRMAKDYASERLAAGRSVPPDIALATTAGGVMQEQSR
jgi:hypothetical protein